MKGVPDFVADSGPLLFFFLLFVVFCRAQTTYWLGRAAAAGLLSGANSSGIRGAVARWFHGPIPQKGVAILNKWGIIIIPLCFLTVGIQTAVNAGAGILRMPWTKYTIAMLPGCVAWAFIYAFGALALWLATVSAIAGSPYAWVLLIVLGALIGAGVFLFRRHQHALDTPTT